jgi:hypothetical protein
VDREYINFYLISELLAEHYELHHSKWTDPANFM